MNGLPKQTSQRRSNKEETHDEEYVINILSKLFKFNPKYGLLFSTDKKFRPTDQLTNTTSNSEPRIHQGNCFTEEI